MIITRSTFNLEKIESFIVVKEGNLGEPNTHKVIRSPNCTTTQANLKNKNIRTYLYSSEREKSSNSQAN